VLDVDRLDVEDDVEDDVLREDEDELELVVDPRDM